MKELFLFFLYLLIHSSLSSCPHDSLSSNILSTLTANTGVTEQSISIDEVRVTERTKDKCCYSGVGTRNLIRFSLSLENSGPEDVLLGTPPPLSPICKMANFGGWKLFECGKNSEWRKVNSYEVKILDLNGTTVIDGGQRHLQIRDDVCEFSKRRYDYLFQGVGKNCAAMYTSNEMCQWIDITELGIGTHALEISLYAETFNVSFDRATLPRYVSPKTGFFRIEAIIPIYLSVILVTLIIL